MVKMDQISSITGGALGAGAKASMVIGDIGIGGDKMFEVVICAALGAIVGFLISKLCAYCWKKIWKKEVKEDSEK